MDSCRPPFQSQEFGISLLLLNLLASPAVFRFQGPAVGQPRYYLSNTPEDTPLNTLAYVGGSRWRIETEFETEKSDVGLDEYETRTWAGWNHHIALCLLGGAFLLSLQQEWGKKMPRITRPQVYRVVGEMLPRERYGPRELLEWLEDTQERNERAKRSHEKRRAARQAPAGIPP